MNNVNGGKYIKALVFFLEGKMRPFANTHVGHLTFRLKFGAKAAQNNSTCVHMDQPQINNPPMQVHSAGAQ